MGTLRAVVSAVESILVSQGYCRAAVNFTLDAVPASTGHRTFTLAGARIAPLYQAANISDYAGSVLGVLILWKARGDHNASGRFQESFLDLLDAYEELETALVKNQPRLNDENNIIASASIAPLLLDGQDWLVLDIELNLDALRAM